MGERARRHPAHYVTDRRSPIVARIITLQPSSVVDQITEDGTELTRLPYPYHVTEDGDVMGQDFWRGEPEAVIGFQRDATVQKVDLWWDDTVADPQQVVGMYPVLRERGNLSTLLIAVESVTVAELPTGTLR
jgi:hypothetical protein